MKEVPKSAWQRSRAMVGLAAKVASKEIGSRLRNMAASSENKSVAALAARVEQAKLLAESLGRMKGALMKAGQLLSIDAGDLLPPEVAEVLSKLQSESEPVDFEAMRSVALEDLGAEKLARFSGLGGVAAASACLGNIKGTLHTRRRVYEGSVISQVVRGTSHRLSALTPVIGVGVVQTTEFVVNLGNGRSLVPMVVIRDGSSIEDTATGAIDVIAIEVSEIPLF